MSATQRIVRQGLVMVMLGLGIFSASVYATDAPATESKSPCFTCHVDIAKTHALSRHSIKDGRTPGDNCATCHGEVLRHMSNPAKEKPQFTFKKDVKGFMDEKILAESNAVCTSCHKGSTQKHWAGSTHASSQVGCVSCHSNHKSDIALNPKTSTALCISCHSDQKANLFKTSSHPLLSGQMNCVSCHNPHGSAPGTEALLKGTSKNETCYTCHPGKRGPFVHAHEAVTEDCANCHNPHGTNRTSMLKANDPMLCMSCHTNAHHNPTLGVASEDKYGRTGCLTCHPRIHGSNAVSGGRFAR